MQNWDGVTGKVLGKRPWGNWVSWVGGLGILENLGWKTEGAGKGGTGKTGVMRLREVEKLG